MFGRGAVKLKIAGVYRVNQPIENFKLRVKIVQQKSLLAELFETEGETRDSNFLESEEKIFQWQEKFFSPFEIKFYKDEKNCHNEIHKEYREKIINQENDEDMEELRIFSYTENDFYYHDKTPITKPGYRSYLSRKNELALPTIANRKPFTERYNKKVIDLYPSDTRIRSNHYLYRKKRVMYIMVDLTSKDEALNDSESAETLLCTITFDEIGKTLTIDPDFNGDDCYAIEGNSMSYDYWIEHVSEHPTDVNKQLQKELIHHELRETHLRIDREAEFFADLQLPAANILRIFLTLDFTEARGFAYDALFLTYSIDLPKYWSTTQHHQLSGRTQRCRVINGRAHFSYITEISLDFDLNSLDNDENVRPCWPNLLVAAASLDSWTRYRIEGYASVSLPPTAGSHLLTLKTWRPITGFVNDLRRFFTGGTAELEDITYCGIPRDHEGSILDKTQLKVVPSGTVEVRMNVIQQSRNFSKYRGTERDTLDRLSAGTLMNSVDNVLEQFKAARARMIQARAMNS